MAHRLWTTHSTQHRRGYRKIFAQLQELTAPPPKQQQPRRRIQQARHYYHNTSKIEATFFPQKTDSRANDVRITQTSFRTEPVDSSSTSNRKDRAFDPSTLETTQMTDSLLEQTRIMMYENKNSSKIISPTNSERIIQHLVAFSGGIDSSLVAYLVHQNNNNNNNKATSAYREEHFHRAVLGVSPAVPLEQIETARRVAQHIGIELAEVSTTEGTDPVYIENAGQACLACKTNLYSTLEAVIQHATSTETSNHLTVVQMYNGTNADDTQDPTRLGLIAAAQFQVQSPLQYTTKQQVRDVSRHVGLPNWNVAASPCLRSRLAFGVQATRHHLYQVEISERYVRQRLADILDETSNLRVRLLSGNTACIEVDESALEAACAIDWTGYFVNKVGFSSVRIRAFKSGSVAGVSLDHDRDSPSRVLDG